MRFVDNTRVRVRTAVANGLRSILENMGVLTPTWKHAHYCALTDWRTKHLGCDCKGD